MTTIFAISVLLAVIGSPAMGACVITKISELPVIAEGGRPIVEARINGQAMRAIVDTGASMTSIGVRAAKRLGLVTEATDQVAVYGVGGKIGVSAAELSSLEIGMFTGRRVVVAVLDDHSTTQETGFDVILGMDLLSRFTLEIDLANGMIRFLKHEGCKPDQLVYWAKSWSEVEIEPLKPDNPHISLTVMLNGIRTSSFLDSGAEVSIATSNTARRAGLPHEATTGESVHSSRGINGKPVDTWLVTAESCSIGDDETIRHVRLRVGDLFAANTFETTGSRLRHPTEAPGMLIGYDFLRAHRAVILFRERKMFLTYNGGPVFQTMQPSAEKSAPDPN